MDNNFRYRCDKPGCEKEAKIVFIDGYAHQYRRPRRSSSVRIRCGEHGTHGFWTMIDCFWYADGRERILEHAGWKMVDRVERHLHRQRV